MKETTLCNIFGRRESHKSLVGWRVCGGGIAVGGGRVEVEWRCFIMREAWSFVSWEIASTWSLAENGSPIETLLPVITIFNATSDVRSLCNIARLYSTFSVIYEWPKVGQRRAWRCHMMLAAARMQMCSWQHGYQVSALTAKCQTSCQVSALLPSVSSHCLESLPQVPSLTVIGSSLHTEQQTRLPQDCANWRNQPN